jgi:two-component system chemotaxis sensor kinase CheA
VSITQDTEAYRRQFCQEIREIIDQVSEDILKAETAPDDRDLLNAIFRGIHTIKGSAGMFGMEALGQFAHHFEELLGGVREGTITLTSDIVDIVLSGTDAIGELARAYEKGERPAVDEGLIDRLAGLLVRDSIDPAVPPEGHSAHGPEGGTRKGQVTLPAGMPAFPEIPPELSASLEGAAEEGLHLYKVEVNFTSELFENGYDPAVLLKNLRSVSARYIPTAGHRLVPALGEFEPLCLYLHAVVYIATDREASEVEEMAFEAGLISVTEVADPGRETSDAGSLDGDSEDSAINEENLREFLIGAGEMTESLEKAVIDYERNSSPHALNEIFRTVHNLKGDAGYIGLHSVVLFAHALESLLERLRSGAVKRTPGIVDLLLKASDFLRDAIGRLNACVKRIELPPLYEQLRQSLTTAPEQGSAEHATGIEPDETIDAFLEQSFQHREILSDSLKAGPLGDDALKIVARSLDGLQKASAFVGLKRLSFLCGRAMGLLHDENALRLAVDGIIEIIAGLEAGPKRLGEILVEEGKISDQDISEVLARRKPIGEMLIEAGKVTTSDVEGALRTQGLMEAASQLRPASAESETRTIRVDEGRIDQLTNMAGEFLVARNTYDYLLGELGSIASVPQAMIRSLKDNLYLFSRVTNEMQQGVMSLRMIPVKGIFQKFQRVVRDIARKQQKMIELVTEGEDTEIDKKVGDMLSDPLIHIIRNSCDHGIETPEERRAAGKPEQGTILLKSWQEGSDLIIRVIDDGRGISRQKVYEKAKSLGMNVASPDDESLLEVIFMPGFSTKAEATDISGRGVGMDVVNTAVASLGGKVEVHSGEGSGTGITLTIPMKMGVSDALLVESLGKTYAFPLDYVVETVKVAPERLRRLHDRWGFFHRNEVLPAGTLEMLLDGGNNGVRKSRLKKREVTSGREEVPMVIVRVGTGKLGVVVDRLCKNMEVAIKPVPESLAQIDVVSGVSILGDGRAVLVLNPEKLV